MYIVGILRQSFNPQLFLTLMFQVFSPQHSTVATVQATVHSTAQEAGLLEHHLTDLKMMRIVRTLRLSSTHFCHLKIVTTPLCDITCRCNHNIKTPKFSNSISFPQIPRIIITAAMYLIILLF